MNSSVLFKFNTGSRFVTEYDVGMVKVDISPAWPEDIGEYKCVATNRWGTDETIGTVNIIPAEEKGEPPKFVTQLPSPGKPVRLLSLSICTHDSFIMLLTTNKNTQKIRFNLKMYVFYVCTSFNNILFYCVVLHVQRLLKENQLTLKHSLYLSVTQR